MFTYLKYVFLIKKCDFLMFYSPLPIFQTMFVKYSLKDFSAQLLQKLFKNKTGCTLCINKQNFWHS